MKTKKQPEVEDWDLRRIKNDKAPNWKGDKVGKSGVHVWLNVNYGKPQFCESCGTETIRAYDWANISGQYKRDREDFLRLCRSCHRRFDLTEIKKDQAVKNLWWNTGSRLRIPIKQINQAGEIIAEYSSVTEAGKLSGIYQTGIYYCILGKLKTAGGFKWERI